MTIPRPAAEAESLDSWGFILVGYSLQGLDWHRKFWFSSRLEMICFMCLGTDSYLNPVDESTEAIDEWRRRRNNIENTFLPTIEASYKGEQEFFDAVQKVARLMGDTKLAWCGQFSNLTQAEYEFPKRLREKFLEDGEFQAPWTEVWKHDGFERFNTWLAEFQGFARTAQV